MHVKWFQNKEKEKLLVVITFDEDTKVRKVDLIRKDTDRAVLIEKPHECYYNREVKAYFVLPANWNPNDYYLELQVNREFIELELQ